jgi:hypothetical protein
MVFPRKNMLYGFEIVVILIQPINEPGRVCLLSKKEKKLGDEQDKGALAHQA